MIYKLDHKLDYNLDFSNVLTVTLFSVRKIYEAILLEIKFV